MPVFLFISGCIADSYLYYACTIAAKGNIVPVSVLHFSENLFLSVWLINPQYNNGSNAPYLLSVALSALAAMIVYAVIKRSQTKAHI
ncbi:MAG: hypothetical protein VB061_09420 [Christensenella sp.]|nr:hypothetical protein [Christensenella sp.]